MNASLVRLVWISSAQEACDLGSLVRGKAKPVINTLNGDDDQAISAHRHDTKLEGCWTRRPFSGKLRKRVADHDTTLIRRSVLLTPFRGLRKGRSGTSAIE